MASSRGKKADQSTPWSKTKWDEARQLYYNDRYGPDGQPEYYWHTVDTTGNEASVPRGFGTQKTSEEVPYETATYSSSATSGTIYPPTGDGSYTTSSGGHSWPASKPTYNSPVYPTQTSSTDTGSDNYGRGIGGYTSPYYGSSQYASGSELVQSATSNATSNAYSSTADGQGGAQGLNSAFSRMDLNPIPEGASSSPMPVAKAIYKEPNSNSYETLDPRYREVPTNEQRKFWKVGRVFMMLWTEPAGPQVAAGGGTLPNGSHISTTWLDGKAYSEIRRFVVLQEGYGNSICSPIQTYSGQATLKPNLPDRNQHAIIHTSKHCPEERFYKADDGTIVWEELSKDPIRVNSEQGGPEGQLEPESRLNYSKIYTVENYVRVLNIGMVDKDSLASLWANSMVFRGTPAEKPTQHAPRSDSGYQSRSGGKGKGKVKGKGKGKG